MVVFLHLTSLVSFCLLKFTSVVWIISIKTYCQVTQLPGNLSSLVNKKLQPFRMVLMWSLYCLYWLPTILYLTPTKTLFIVNHCRNKLKQVIHKSNCAKKLSWDSINKFCWYFHGFQIYSRQFWKMYYRMFYKQ